MSPCLAETKEPIAPFKPTSPETQRLAHLFREKGLYTFVRSNFFHTNPPLMLTQEELDEELRIIDEALAEPPVGPEH